MNKSILWLIGLLFVTSLSIVSCSESDGTEDKYADWEVRNQRYIDSIATVAEANQGEKVGQWKIIRSYKLGELGLNETGSVNHNVYCKILAKGDGDVFPFFTDSVNVHYKGQLIPLSDGQKVVFDRSYKGEELDLETDLPKGFWLNSSLIAGWPTALQKMKTGDRWEIYIPFTLAYGKEGRDNIPGYSTLIFDMYLTEIIPLKGTERSLIENLDADAE